MKFLFFSFILLSFAACGVNDSSKSSVYFSSPSLSHKADLTTAVDLPDLNDDLTMLYGTNLKTMERFSMKLSVLTSEKAGVLELAKGPWQFALVSWFETMDTDQICAFINKEIVNDTEAVDLLYSQKDCTRANFSVAAEDFSAGTLSLKYMSIQFTEASETSPTLYARLEIPEFGYHNVADPYSIISIYASDCFEVSPTPNPLATGLFYHPVLGNAYALKLLRGGSTPALSYPTTQISLYTSSTCDVKSLRARYVFNAGVRNVSNSLFTYFFKRNVLTGVVLKMAAKGSFVVGETTDILYLPLPL